jgi:trans-aconitate 2-methyltransferase
MHRHNQQHYTFGDSDVAARRLALLAAVFEPSSARLLRRVGYLQPRYALDLGCGPGWSTRLVHALLGPQRTLGIDRSAEHLARASETAPPGVAYRAHEVTCVPFPTAHSDAGPDSGAAARPDFLYSRFLLTHLREPERVVAAWASAAAENAVLVLEETADLRCDHPAFARYYQLVDQLQASYGQRLRIGATLDAAPPGSGWKTDLSLLVQLSLPARQMARLHALNIQSWRTDPYARASFDTAELDGLAARLHAIALGDEAAPPVASTMRQLILSREGGS